MKKRLYEVMKKGAVVLAIGCAYSIFHITTGLGIPCVIHEITGLKCPGCGVTRMLLALIRLDFRTAFGYNAVLLCMLPLLAALLAVSVIRYIRTGSRKLTRPENGIMWAMIVILLAWGVVRNLPGVYFG